MDELYLAIADELLSENARSYLIDKGLQPVKHVALFNNQYRYEKEEIAYPLPAVFIEFPNAIYRNKSRQVDSVEERIRIHIEQKNYADSSYNSKTREKSLQVLQFIRAIDIIMLAIRSPMFGPMYRVDRQLDTDHGNAPVHIREYTCQYTDEGTDKFREYIPSSANAELGVSKQLMDDVSTPLETGGSPYQV